ncbi:YsnF/AvaK domain-containing protein [Peribacillus kribbensis]|uniref:YsnF/AvaK domain-containing protein n=1 Tax=Peribacillus kribbensis TaxID=356658 RepID=UPI0003F6F03B|nr:YsnF/AvaK domain-containing protein [Peribacillus kribbensis]
MAKRVVGVFDSQEEAIQAIRDLTSQGYDTDQISVLTNRRDNSLLEDRTGATVDRDVHSGTAAGNDDESFWDKMKHFFTMDDMTDTNSRLAGLDLTPAERDAYTSHLDDGKYLVTVDGDTNSSLSDGTYQTDANFGTAAPGYNDTLTGTATGAFAGTGAVADYDTDTNRSADTDYDATSVTNRTADKDSTATRRSAGSDYDSTLTGGPTAESQVDYGRDTNANYETASTGRIDTETDEEQKLKLREEQLDINKNEVQTGEVEVNKEVTEEQKTVEVPVKREEVYVERRSVDNEITDADGEFNDNETIRVPIVEEQIEVSKRPVVTDEVVIGKRTVEDSKHVTETVRKEEANLNTSGNPKINGDDSLNTRRNSNLDDRDDTL